MPVKSESQRRLMQGVANNPAFAKKVGIPQSVGREYVGKGEDMKDMPMMMKAPKGKKPPMKKPPMKKMASGGLAAGHKAADGIAHKGKTKGKMVKMAYGGKC